MDLALLIEDCFLDSILPINLRDFSAVLLACASTFSSELLCLENKGLSQLNKDSFQSVSSSNDDKLSDDGGVKLSLEVWKTSPSVLCLSTVFLCSDYYLKAFPIVLDS